MFKRKNNNIFFITGILLFTLFLFSSMVTAGILAKYSRNNSNDDIAQVAKFYVDETISEQSMTLSLSSSSIVSFDIQIVNYTESIICETAFNYSFTISTLDNLPLKIIVSEKSLMGTGNFGTISNLSCTNGYMGVNSKEMHTYTVSISWDTSIAGWNDYENSKKVDLVIINFNAIQID